MATTRFKTTLDAIKGGVKNFTIDKAVQNIEGWEEYLGKHDQDGVKAVVKDLGKLKKLLQAKEIDGEAVKKLVAKMGKDTVKVAGEGGNAESKHIRELGEALSNAADKGDEDEDAETEKGVDAKDLDDEEVADEDEDLDDEDEDLDDEDDEDEDEDVDDDEDEDESDDEDADDEDEDEPKAPAKKSVAKKASKAPAKKTAVKSRK